MKDKSRKERPLTPGVMGRIDDAWDALERGDIETASAAAETLMDETEGHPEVRFLFGAALLESGYPSEALEELESVKGLVDNPNVHLYYTASTLYELTRYEEAEGVFQAALDHETEDQTPIQYGYAQVLEHLGRYSEAESLYEKAHTCDPDSYPLPTRMQREAFERVVQEACETLPEELKSHLDDVPVVVQDLPERSVLAEGDGETITPSILGMFIGRSLREKSVFDAPDVPPTIFIYQRNLERICTTREELIHEISLTLYHELGHYLGLEEEDLEARGLD